MSKEKEISKLKKTLGVVTDHVPGLIKGIIDGIYSSEESKKLAENTANFYNKLIESGMDEDKAFQLTKEFMKSRDVRNIVREALGKDNFMGENIDSAFNDEEEFHEDEE